MGSEQNSIFLEQHYRIRSYEVDPAKRLKLFHLVNFMQDAAWINAAQMGVSVDQLMSAGMTWILSRMKLDIIRMPLYNENIRVLTWPSGYERYFAFRDFRVMDEAGVLIARATTTWLVLDLNSRKLVLPSQFADLLKINGSIEAMPAASGRIKLPDPVENSYLVEILDKDMDQNEHTNNAYYLQWMMERVAAGKETLRQIDVLFKMESRAGDVIRVDSGSGGEGTILHSIAREGSEELLVQAVSVWE